MSTYGNFAFKTIDENQTRLMGADFPVKSTNTGGLFSASYDILNVRAGLIQLLLTRRGERAMMPDFGTDARELVFEPLDAGTTSRLESQVQDAVNKYMPEIIINKLSVKATDKSSSLTVLMLFSIKEDIKRNHRFGLTITDKTATIL
jgi:hypothetical protein